MTSIESLVRVPGTMNTSRTRWRLWAQGFLRDGCAAPIDLKVADRSTRPRMSRPARQAPKRQGLKAATHSIWLWKGKRAEVSTRTNQSRGVEDRTQH